MPSLDSVVSQQFAHIEKTHAETFWDYQGGKFIINRTTKPFPGNPIDLAASQKTGNSSIANSVSVCQRWAESYFLRTTVISYLFEDFNLTKKEDTTKSLKASNINKNNFAVKKIKYMIENNLNTFNKNASPDHLFNTCTGKSCKKCPEDFL